MYIKWGPGGDPDAPPVVFPVPPWGKPTVLGRTPGDGGGHADIGERVHDSVAGALPCGTEGKPCGCAYCKACAAAYDIASDTAWTLGVIGGGREEASGLFWQLALLYDAMTRRATEAATSLRRSIHRALVGAGVVM
jgi:hypothetical protein